MDTERSAENAAQSDASLSRSTVPDFARGAMLLLIAIANVWFWMPDSALDQSQMQAGDSAAVLIDALIADQRGYPLFSLLLGFGIAVLAKRYTADFLAEGLDEQTAKQYAAMKLRRRGLWLAVFGAVHAVVYPLEVLGVYGIATAVLASLVVMGRTKALVSIGAVITAIALGFVAVFAAEPGGPGSSDWSLQPGENLLMWAVNTPAMLVLSLAVPMMILGVLLAGTKVLFRPDQYRAALVALVPLVPAGAALSLFHGLYAASLSPRWDQILNLLHIIGGAAAALGILASIALLCSYSAAVRPNQSKAVIALGRQSLTGYLMQTLLFGLWSLMIHFVVEAEVSALDGLLIAVLVWVVSLIFCDGLSFAGRDRPAETLLRRVMSWHTARSLPGHEARG